MQKASNLKQKTAKLFIVLTILTLIASSSSLVLARDGADDPAGDDSSSGSSGSGGSSSGSSSSDSFSENEIRREPEVRGRESEMRGSEDDQSQTRTRTQTRGQEVEIRGREAEDQGLDSVRDRQELQSRAQSSEVREFEVRNSNGRLELELRDRNNSFRRILSSDDTSSIKVDLNQGQEKKEVELGVRREDDDGALLMTIKAGGREVMSNFPLIVNRETSQLFVRTGQTLKEIRILPDQAAEIARERFQENEIERIELKSNGEAENESVEFRVIGQREGKFLWLIPMKAQIVTEIDARSGEVVHVEQPQVMSLLSLLIR